MHCMLFIYYVKKTFLNNARARWVVARRNELMKNPSKLYISNGIKQVSNFKHDGVT